MSKIAIVTDSNSGITQSEAGGLGIHVLPMPFMVDGETYYEEITLSQREFYEKLAGNADISTSQPSPDSVIKLWDGLLEEYDEVVHIPMSSGLSGSCETAMMLAGDYDGKVHVVNNQRISVTQKRSVLDAIELAKAGQSGGEIKDILERDRSNSSIYIMIDTLYYLKKGGRITPAVAALGTLLRLKPVLQIQGDKLDTFAKARTVAHAKSIMINAVRSDIEKRFGGMSSDNHMHLAIAHTQNEDAAMEFKAEVEAHLPGYHVTDVDPLSLSVSCHIGPGALALTCSKKLI